jgi:hypothetical protein
MTLDVQKSIKLCLDENFAGSIHRHLSCDTGPTDKNVGKSVVCSNQTVYESVDWIILAHDTVHLIALMNRVKIVPQQFEFSKQLSNCKLLKKTQTSRRFNSCAVSACEWN